MASKDMNLEKDSCKTRQPLTAHISEGVYWRFVVVVLIVTISTQSILFEVIGVSGNAFVAVQLGLKFFFRHGRGDDLAGRRKGGHCAMWIKDCRQLGGGEAMSVESWPLQSPIGAG